MNDKRYITIHFRNGNIHTHKGEIPLAVLDAADDGFYGVVDITDPDHLISYQDGQWISVDDLSV